MTGVEVEPEIGELPHKSLPLQPLPALVDAAVAAGSHGSNAVGSLDSVRHLKAASPEKKQKTTKMPVFGDPLAPRPESLGVPWSYRPTSRD